MEKDLAPLPRGGRAKGIDWSRNSSFSAFELRAVGFRAPVFFGPLDSNFGLLDSNFDPLESKRRFPPAAGPVGFGAKALRVTLDVGVCGPVGRRGTFFAAFFLMTAGAALVLSVLSDDL